MGRAANGVGSIRKKIITKNGKEYNYWEARYTEGYDPVTGKQKQRSILCKTQKEAAQKLKAATASIDAGTYTIPSKMTVGQWLDIWTADYLGNVKPRTVETYHCQIRNHIRPVLGSLRLDALNPHIIQRFFNSLTEEKDGKPGLAPKSVKNIHGILHKALEQAVTLKYLGFNPADKCILPKVVRKELKPLDEDAVKRFIAAIKGHPFELVIWSRCSREYVRESFWGLRGTVWTSAMGQSSSGSRFRKQRTERVSTG